jgi:type II secretory pathway pseudopilin PulG
MSVKLSAYLGNRGDTIVEVLLAVAIVSAVLGGAYVSTSRSLANARQAQERSEAVKLVEGQLEKLKVAFTANPAGFSTGGAFCLDDTPARVTAGSAICTQGRYVLSVEHTGNNFTARALWDKFNGNGGTQEEVRIVYRLYE